MALVLAVCCILHQTTAGKMVSPAVFKFQIQRYVFLSETQFLNKLILKGSTTPIPQLKYAQKDLLPNLPAVGLEYIRVEF